MKKRVLLILAGSLLVGSLLAGCSKTCQFAGCDKNASSGDYCTAHSWAVGAVDAVKGFFGG